MIGSPPRGDHVPGGARAWRAMRRLPELVVIWVPLLLCAGQVVVFTAWTTWISFTPSTLMPTNGWVGLRNYRAILASRNWHIAFDNLLIFGSGFVVLTIAAGLLLAVLLDQRIRGENVMRTIFLYPLAVSFVVTGTVWSWLLNPGIGVQKLVQGLGWSSFRFDWLVQPDMAIYTIIIAAVWQASGFAMALFTAGLRSVEPDLIKAAQIDGAGFFRTFWRIVLPLSPPILIVTVIWQFTGIYNEFLYGVTFTNGTQQPITAALISLTANVANVPQYGVQSAAVLIAAAPTLLVYLLGGRWFVRGLTAGAVK